MAGIGTDRGGLQVGPVTQIGQDTQVTPAVTDFMDAFRSGFITTDDITRRAQEAVVRPSELELRQKQNEQGILDTETIRPQQRDLASKQLTAALDNQDIVAELARQKLKQDQQTQANAGAAIPPLATVQGAAAAQTKIVGEAATAVTGTPEEQGATANEQQNRVTIQEYAKVVGAVPPILSLPQGIKPAPFNTWVKNYHGPEVTPQLAAIPEGPGKEAIVENFLEKLSKDPRIHADYEKYRQETASRKMDVTPADPEYYEYLREQVTKKQKELGVEAATLKALPGVIENESKLAAERPAQVQKLVGDIKTEMNNNKELSLAVLSDRAFATAKALANKPNPTNQDDLGLVYATVKSFDPNAVREGEIKLFQQGIGFPGQAELLFNRITGNKNAVLRPQERASLSSLIDTLQESSNKSTLPVLRTYFNRAVSGNAPLDQVFNSDQLKLLISNPSGAGTAAAAPVAGAVTAPAAAGTSQKIQNGNLFERQPDGSYKFIRKV